MHSSFDCWTGRADHHYLGISGSLIAPWRRVKRLNVTLAVEPFPGRERGVDVAAKVTGVAARFGITVVRTHLHRDWQDDDGVMQDYNTITDIRRTLLSTATDSGGGVSTACRKLGRPYRSCFLHSGEQRRAGRAASSRRGHRSCSSRFTTSSCMCVSASSSSRTRTSAPRAGSKSSASSTSSPAPRKRSRTRSSTRTPLAYSPRSRPAPCF